MLTLIKAVNVELRYSTWQILLSLFSIPLLLLLQFLRRSLNGLLSPQPQRPLRNGQHFSQTTERIQYA